jgi:phospholipase/carboxylesterase
MRGSLSRLRRQVLLALALVLATGCRGGPARAAGDSAPVSSAPAEAAGVRYLEQVTGGADAREALPMIVGLHGLGGQPERFARVVAGLGVRARLILPYGLMQAGEGFAWFDLREGDAAAHAHRLQQAADRLAAMIEVLVKTRPTRGKVIVTGFSQGGMLSFALAALHPEVIGAAFPLSGMLVPKLWPRGAPDAAARPEVHAFHGVADDRVPIADARMTIAALRTAGFTADLREYPGVPHTITPEMRADVRTALEAAARR